MSYTYLTSLVPNSVCSYVTSLTYYRKTGLWTFLIHTYVIAGIFILVGPTICIEKKKWFCTVNSKYLYGFSWKIQKFWTSLELNWPHRIFLLSKVMKILFPISIFSCTNTNRFYKYKYTPNIASGHSALSFMG